eukprot:14371370-Ditylum_brightwellii.AAC.1
MVNIDAAWSAARAFNTLALIGGFLWIMTDFFRTCAHGRIKAEPIWMGYVLPVSYTHLRAHETLRHL